jgi:hypothetical protein
LILKVVHFASTKHKASNVLAAAAAAAVVADVVSKNDFVIAGIAFCSDLAIRTKALW